MTHSTPPTPDPQPRTFVPFNVAAVRITYITPGTVKVARSAPSAPVSSAAGTTSIGPAVLADLVELATALRSAVGLPALVIVVNDGFDTGAEAVAMSCLPVPQVRLSIDLLDEQNSARLQGALAHERGRFALGHLSRPSIWRRIAVWCGVGALLALAAHLPAWLVVALAAVAAANHLLATQAQRLQEYDADFYSARLLGQVGRDGTAIVAATLTSLPAPSRWQRTIGQITGSHPTLVARLRVLTSHRLLSWYEAGSW